MRRIALVFLLAAPVFAGEEDRSARAATSVGREWSAESLDMAATLPVQEHGRVKPLSTVASFAMLRIHFKRRFEDSAERSRKPMAWLLDTLLYRDSALRERIFLVENRDALDAIGLRFGERKRRDYYSYEELSPGRSRLFGLGHEYGKIEKTDRTPVQTLIVTLAHNLMEFERLAIFLDFARAPLEIPPELAPAFGGRNRVRLSEMLRTLPSLRREGLLDGATVAALRREAQHHAEDATALALFPPLGTEPEAEWFTPADLAHVRNLAPEHLDMLARLEELVLFRDDPALFRNSLAALEAATSSAAEARDEYAKVELEAFYYRIDPVFHSLLVFLLAFVLVAATWMRPNSRWLKRSVWITLLAALGVLAFGIVIRCVLRGRPPVTTLYETILFITWTGVASLLVVELLNRRHIALSAAPLMGWLGLYIAGKFEVLHGSDTIDRLQAVLDTNFWLATHVTCITFGYAAALVASAIAHVYVIGRALGWRSGDKELYRDIVRMTYGVVLFALLLSVVGTILGGVWANESWGRFWGWDPKENGALMIVLVQLSLLHARMGGYIRDLGFCLSVVVAGVVVSWSWWGVNLLGIGLHSYGFTGGIWTGLITFWAIESVVLLTGIPAKLRALG